MRGYHTSQIGPLAGASGWAIKPTNHNGVQRGQVPPIALSLIWPLGLN